MNREQWREVFQIIVLFLVLTSFVSVFLFLILGKVIISLIPLALGWGIMLAFQVFKEE